jgi:hypothetical protein
MPNKEVVSGWYILSAIKSGEVFMEMRTLKKNTCDVNEIKLSKK